MADPEANRSATPVPHRGTEPADGSFRERLWRIIFLSDTRAGRAFDVVLLVVILLCVLVVMLDSVQPLHRRFGPLFRTAEWTFTALFTIEYFVRLWVVRNRWNYARSFFGVVDLVALLPTYLELVFAGSHYLITVRVLRLLRMFRVLKMADHLGEAGVLLNALRASRRKISVFLLGVLAVVCVEGTMMYVLENGVNPGFNNIPQSMYWAVVTLTTVGYGDVSPMTVLGKVMASLVMLTGFAIIAVPTGVVTVELNREIARGRRPRRVCNDCGWDLHDPQALFCQQCGRRLG